jgi:hypothetical protein
MIFDLEGYLSGILCMIFMSNDLFIFFLWDFDL